MANKIGHKTCFSWWLLFTLQKKNKIVSKLNNKYWCTTHKFWIEVPKPEKQAYELNDKIVTDFWRRSIAKEMMKVKVAYVEKEGTPD